MPIYEYHCPKCGDFEAMQKISDKPLAQCPTCRRAVTKLMSTTSFQLKGSGWYITDYARKQEGKDAAKGDDKKADETKTDTKESASSPTATSEVEPKKKGGKKKGKEKAAAA